MNEQINSACIEEDEIDLRELFATIWKHKLFIAVFTFIITSLAIVYALSKPNEYKVYTLLAPQEASKGMNLGGLGALASMAGVNVGGGGSGITPDIAFTTLLNDYAFMKNFILKNQLDKKLSDATMEQEYVFALGYNGIYRLFHSKAKNDNKDQTYNYYKQLKGALQVSTDKKTSLITVSYTAPSRKFAKEVLEDFLRDATQELVGRNLRDINAKVEKYKQELQKTNNLELKSELAKLISSLIKQKVYINASKYYKVKVVTDPYIPDVKDKAKPKRALIVIVAFITSIIIGIFLVFFLEFIRKDEA
ncbi:Lipopolysaccharide biosynthesis [hydrothermal vent metagenome]|uniref:Lipopolysaccharide biosynthesis n=1 Tax=hydrothermal vent metagenome TaxID=652676 RepID=A0A1W1BNW7_9ZZZZ